MAITGTTLLANLGDVLQDSTEAVWGNFVRAGFINEAVSLIVLLRPDAVSTAAEFDLVASSPKQEIPSDGLRFLGITRNVDGRPVTRADRETMNSVVPAWTLPATVTGIEHFMFDKETPRLFYVYPVPDTAVTVELVYAQSPETFTPATSLPLPDHYLAPVMEYAQYRCFSMNSKRINLNRAATHLNAFYNALGVKGQNDAVLAQVQEG